VFTARYELNLCIKYRLIFVSEGKREHTMLIFSFPAEADTVITAEQTLTFVTECRVETV